MSQAFRTLVYCLTLSSAVLFSATATYAQDVDNDGLDATDPCPLDPLNRCFGPVAVDGNTGNDIRLNANVSGSECSGTKIDCNGDTWLADFGFNTGNSASCNLGGGGEGCVISGITAIFGCDDEETEDIFQCERWDPAPLPEVLYSFDVPDGLYVVNLLFANTFTGTANPGTRLFDILVEGQVVYDDFDQVVAAGGSGVAVVRSAVVTVSDGNGLQIELGHVVENPAIKGLEVLQGAECDFDIDCDDGNDCTLDTCDGGLCSNTPTTDPCDDGDACTTGDTCSGGACVGGPPPNCDDGNPCTADSCDSFVGCINDPTMDPCDDGDPCTTDDTCDGAGNCAGAPVDCSALDDQCNVGVCVPDPNSGVAIRINVNGPAHNGVDFPGTWAADSGLGGVCGPNAFTTGASINGTVDDPLFQGEVFGNPVTCAVGGGTLPAGTYTVNLYFAEIFFGPGCQGGGAGTGARVFDIALEGVTQLTGFDIFAEGGCAASNTDPTTIPIVKSFSVTINDGTLDISLPASVNNAKISAIEILAPGAQCEAVPANEGGDCDDGDACTTADTCSGGSCVGGPPPDCDDGNVCTDDSCDPLTGCVNDPNTDPCDDGDACTTADTCAGGSCVGGPPPDCDDGNVCTDDSCDPATGCLNDPNTDPCEDGDPCTSADGSEGGADQCDGAGNCVGIAVDCSAFDDQCNTGTCNPADGVCFADPAPHEGDPCQDGNACTSAGGQPGDPDACVAGDCVGDPVVCDDADVCTDDSCDPATGCVFTYSEDNCDLDIKPTSCPNPLNGKSNGVIPVALVGSDVLDPADVDLGTVRLCLGACSGDACTESDVACIEPLFGPPGPEVTIEDVASPFANMPPHTDPPNSCDDLGCHELGADGTPDLSLKFRTKDLVNALLGAMYNLVTGESLTLHVCGNLLNGDKFCASDCMRIVQAGGNVVAHSSNQFDVFMEASLPDVNGDADGWTTLARDYEPGTVVTLTAPPVLAGGEFLYWTLQGVPQPAGLRTVDIAAPDGGGNFVETATHAVAVYTNFCLGDLNGDESVDPTDLALLLGGWGQNFGHPGDFDGDGLVNSADLAAMLGNWGVCE